MKKFLLILSVSLLLFSITGAVSADQYYENFYGTAEDNLYDELWEGYRATIAFDITGTNYFSQPTTDETGYDPSLGLTSAELNFTFSSEDDDIENIKVKTGFWDGNALLAERTYDLGYTTGYYETYRTYWTFWDGWHYATRWVETGSVREYASLSIDIGAAGLLDYMQDGHLTSIVISPYKFGYANDIRLDQASLIAESAPVPEPATMLLLGSGLVGLAGFRRKFKK